MTVLPYGRHLIEDDDVAAVVAALRSDFLTTGPAVAAFEQALAAAVAGPDGPPFAVACANGTAGLHLAALALGLGPGDVAIVPALSFVATANGVVYCGADVVFADVDPATGLMTPETFAEALARAAAERPGGTIKAAFPVHLNGQTADMRGIGAIAAAREIALVEDACHALGGASEGPDGRRVPIGSGDAGAMTMFSLHPVKTAAMGEGGVVATKDPELDRRLRLLRAHGIERDPDRLEIAEQALAPDGTVNPWYYEMVTLGYNYRASDLNCALGLSQVRKLPRFVARRRHLAALYDTAFAARPDLPARPIPRVPWCDPAWHLYVVRIDFAALGRPRAEVMRRLRAQGVGTQVHYLPIPDQPFYRRRYGAQALPGARAYYDQALSIPLFPGMTDDDVGRVVEALESALS